MRKEIENSRQQVKKIWRRALNSTLDQGERDILNDLLTHSESGVQKLALKAYGRHGERNGSISKSEQENIISLINNENSEFRALAATTIRFTADSFGSMDESLHNSNPAINAVAELLKDEKPEPRREAVLTLGQFDAYYVKDYFDDMSQLFEDDIAEVRQVAIRAFGQFKRVHIKDYFDDMASLLIDDVADVRREAVRTFGQFKPVHIKNYFDDIAGLLDDGVAEVRQETVRVLCQFRHSLAIDYIDDMANLLDDDVPKVRSEAVQGLRSFRYYNVEEYIDDMACLLDDDVAKVRKEAVRSFSSFDTYEIEDYLDDIVPLLDDDMPEVRQAAVQTVGRFNSFYVRDHIGDIINLLDDDVTEVRGAAARALVEADPRRSLPVDKLVNLLDEDEAPKTRKYAVMALAKAADSNSSKVVTHTDALAALLEEGDPETRKNAVAALRRVASESPEDVAIYTADLASLLDEKDRETRSHAAAALHAIAAVDASVIGSHVDWLLSYVALEAEAEPREDVAAALSEVAIAAPDTLATHSPQLRRLIEASDPPVSKQLIITLRELAGSHASELFDCVDKLYACVTDEKSDELRLEAIRALRAIAKKEPEQLMTELDTEDRSPFVETFVSLSNDTEEKLEIRVTAARILQVVGAELPEAVTNHLDRIVKIAADSTEPTKLKIEIVEILESIASGSSDGTRVTNHVETLVSVLNESNSTPLRTKVCETLETIAEVDADGVVDHIDSLFIYLDDDQIEEVQRNTAAILSHVADSRPEVLTDHVEELLPLFEDYETLKHSATAVGRVAGWDQDHVERYIEKRVSKLNDSSDNRNRVVYWLRWVALDGGQAVTPFINKQIFDPLLDPDNESNTDSILGNTADLLGRVEQARSGTITDFADKLGALLSDGDAFSRRAASFALGQIAKTSVEDVEQYVSKFVELLDDSDERRVRRQASSALGMVASEAPEILKPHTDILINNLNDEFEQVRYNCVFALKYIAEQSPTEVADHLKGIDSVDSYQTSLVSTLHDSATDTRYETVRTIQRITEGGSEAPIPYVPDLVYRLDKSSEYRAQIVYGLGRIEQEHPGSIMEYVEEIKSFVGDGDSLVRENTAYALGTIAVTQPDEIVEYADTLADLLSDENTGVRIEAAWALSHLALNEERRDNIIETLIDGLEYDQPHMRQKAIETLADLEAVTALPVLRDHRNREPKETVCQTFSTTIEILEDHVETRVEAHTEEADNHFERAREAFHTEDYEEAITAFRSEQDAYKEAITLARNTGCNELARKIERNLDKVVDRIVFARREHLRKRKDQIIGQIEVSPKQAKERLQTVLDEIEELQTATDGDSPFREGIEDIAIDAQEQLWRAHIEPLRQEVENAQALWDDGREIDAMESFEEVEELIDAYNNPPARATKPADSAGINDLQDHCDDLITADPLMNRMSEILADIDSQEILTTENDLIYDMDTESTVDDTKSVQKDSSGDVTPNNNHISTSSDRSHPDHYFCANCGYKFSAKQTNRGELCTECGNGYVSTDGDEVRIQ